MQGCQFRLDSTILPQRALSTLHYFQKCCLTLFQPCLIRSYFIRPYFIRPYFIRPYFIRTYFIRPYFIWPYLFRPYFIQSYSFQPCFIQTYGLAAGGMIVQNRLVALELKMKRRS